MCCEFWSGFGNVPRTPYPRPSPFSLKLSCLLSAGHSPPANERLRFHHDRCARCEENLLRQVLCSESSYEYSQGLGISISGSALRVFKRPTFRGDLPPVVELLRGDEASYSACLCISMLEERRSRGGARSLRRIASCMSDQYAALPTGQQTATPAISPLLTCVQSQFGVPVTSRRASKTA